MIKIFFPVALAVFLVLIKSPIIADQVQYSDINIPLFPGSEIYEQPKPYSLGGIIQETLRALPGNPPVKDGFTNCYITAEKRDIVYGFYLKKLNGVNMNYQKWISVDPLLLKPGDSTPVYYESMTVSGGVVHTFHWYRKSPGGDINFIEITICNFYYKKGYNTQVGIMGKTYSKSVPNIIPSEDELGVSKFPESVYDSSRSSTIGGGIFYHYFLTRDSMENVKNFYEQKLNIKAWKGEPGGGGINYFFRGYSKAHSEDTLIIEDEKDLADLYKTRISFTLNHNQ